MNCPVPSCNKHFNSLKKLSKHLNSTVRGSRCGAYTRDIEFLCQCGEICPNIAMIKAHALIHGARSNLCEEVNSYEEIEGFNQEDEEVMESDLEGLNCDEALDIGDALIDGDSNVYHQDVVRSRDAYLPMETLPNSMRQLQVDRYHYLLEGNGAIKAIIELYRFCLGAHSTNKAYKQLRSLSVFACQPYLPANYKDLRRQVETFLQMNIGWPAPSIFSVHSIAGKEYSTPYLPVSCALSIWFAVPAILHAVKVWNAIYLPEDLMNEEQYAALLLERETRIGNGTHVYGNVADGSIYLENVRSAIPLFREEYTKAKADGIDVLVCNFGLYEDGFAKNLNSLVTQTIVTLTLGKSYTIILFVIIYICPFKSTSCFSRSY